MNETARGASKADRGRTLWRRSGWFLAILFVWLFAWRQAMDERALRLLLTTAELGALVSLAAWPLAVVLGWLVSRTNLPGRRTLSLALLGMLFLPLYVQAAAWQAAFAYEGWYSLRGHAPLEGWPAVVWVHAWSAVPWLVLIASIGFRQVEPHLEEMALLEGSAWRAWRRTTCRRAAAPLALAAIWGMLAVAAEMTVTDLFRVRSYAEEIYTEFAVQPPEKPEDALRWAPQWLFLASTFAIALAAIGAWSRSLPRTPPLSPRIWPLGLWKTPLTLFAIAAVAVIVAGPLGGLAWKAGVTTAFDGAERLRSWSAGKFVERCASSVLDNRREFAWTYGLGGGAACMATVIGGALAWLAVRGGKRSWPALAIASATWALPGPIVGMAIIAAFRFPNWPWLDWLYDRTAAPVLVAQTWRALGVAIPILWFSLRTVSRDQFELAALDGLGALRRWHRLAWQPRRGAWGAAWLAGLALAMGDLPATWLVRPPLVDTLPTLVWSRLHTGLDDEAAALCLTQWFTSQLLVLFAYCITRRCST